MSTAIEKNATDQPGWRIKFLGLCLYAIVVCGPAIVANMLDDQLTINGMVHWLIGTTGIVAYSIVSLQFVLAARINWIEKQFGPTSIFRLHQTMAIVSTLLAILHVALLLFNRGESSLVLSLRSSWPVWFGRVCLGALFTMIAYSLCRNIIPLNKADWRWFHAAIAWVILVFGFAHSLTLGSSFENPVCAGCWILYLLLAVSAWLSQYLPSTKIQK